MGGWIVWIGGTCPVDRYATVQIKLRGGEWDGRNWSACQCDWRHLPHDATQDIIAYRIVKDS